MKITIIGLWKYILEDQVLSKVIIVIITALITHLFEVIRIKTKQDSTFQASLGEKIASAYLAVRDVELKLQEIEAFEPSVIFQQKRNGKADSVVYYPSVLDSSESLLEYCNCVSGARRQYEPYISSKASAYLATLEKYLLELCMFLSAQPLRDATQALGFFLILDIQKIQRDFDALIVQEINRPRYRLESKTSSKYKKSLKQMKKKYIDQSELMKIHDNETFLEIMNSDRFFEKHNESSSLPQK